MTAMMDTSIDPSAVAFPAATHLSVQRTDGLPADLEAMQLEAYFQEVKGFSLLSADTEGNLATQVRQGKDQAWRQLIGHNLRLVIRIAHRYKGHGVPLADLVQEENPGLLHAARSYDPSIARFSTHAYWWINQHIVRALHKHSTLIRLPSHVHEEELIPLKQARSRLLQERGEEPSIQELAHKTGMTVERINEVLRAATPAIPLDEPCNTRIDLPIVDIIAENTESVEEQVMQPIIAREIRELLQEILPPRYCTVLQLRYGFDETPTQTFAAIGKQLGITYQRVRQIEAAVREMLHYSPQFLQLYQALTEES